MTMFKYLTKSLHSTKISFCKAANSQLASLHITMHVNTSFENTFILISMCICMQEQSDSC